MITAVKSVRRAFGRPCLLNWRMKTDSSVCSGKKDHYLYEQQIEEGDQVILEQEILKRIE